MISFKINYLRIILGGILGLLMAAVQAAPAGKIIFANGDAQIVSSGSPARDATKNTVVNEGDTLVTGKTGAIHLRMNDDGFIAVRPDTRLTVQQFIWNGKEDGNERSALSLLKGGFRTITGVIGRRSKENYSVRTPTATIGIRGTDHEPHYIEPPAPGESAQSEPGTYNKVNVGATFIRNASGTVELGPNEAGFASATPGKAPARLSVLPGFMRNAPTPLGTPDRSGGLDDDSGTRRQAFASRLVNWVDGDEERKQIARALLRFAVVVAGSGLDLNIPAREAFSVAPAGTALVGGLSTPAGLQDNGGLFVTTANNNLILLGPGNRPLFIGVSDGGFRYSRDLAPLVDSGQAAINGTAVNWGIYAGGAVFVANGAAQTPQYFYFMATANFTALADLALPGAAGYNTVVGFTKPINEAGQVGGNVLLQVAVTFGANPLITTYNLGVQDAAGRNWNAALTGTQSLVAFAPGGGGGNNLNVTCAGACPTAGTGKATGYVIGGANRDGLISSYTLRAGATASVTGAVAVK